MRRSFASAALLTLAPLFVVGCPAPVSPVSVTTTPPPAVAAAPDQAPDPVVEQLVENFSRVHFDYDDATLDASTRAVLDENARILMEHRGIQIEVQGHADERGTTDYNLALGDRRADAVRDYLALQGVAPSRVAIVSYGEEIPLDGSASERAWSQNRRAEFRVTHAGDAQVEGTVD